MAIELPEAELEAVASGGQLSDVLDRIAGHVREHRTTLVFVNTRKMAERVAHQLALRLARRRGGGVDGADGSRRRSTDIDAALQVAAHHGSLSAARRRMVEQRLRAGDLRALVATASLELGIDVGPVELVCQIGSPRAIGTFLQRVGRANHQLEGTPAGRLYPMTRDELVECTALLAAVRAGLSTCSSRRWPRSTYWPSSWWPRWRRPRSGRSTALRAGPCGPPPTPTSPREPSTTWSSWCRGVSRPGGGRRGAHLHHDAVNGRLRARRGAGWPR